MHGVHITACREGQAAAALADILLRGLSQMRMRRLSTLLRAYPGPLRDLPEGWVRLLPADAPLTSRQAWTRLLEGGWVASTMALSFARSWTCSGKAPPPPPRSVNAC